MNRKHLDEGSFKSEVRDTKLIVYSLQQSKWRLFFGTASLHNHYHNTYVYKANFSQKLFLTNLNCYININSQFHLPLKGRHFHGETWQMISGTLQPNAVFGTAWQKIVFKKCKRRSGIRRKRSLKAEFKQEAIANTPNKTVKIAMGILTKCS